MNELALFAGAGGGIWGGKLLGWRTVCAVEWEPYAGLEWRDVEMARRYLRTRGKTPAATREVPLSSEALEVLEQLDSVRDGQSVFGISAASLDALFRKAREKAGVEDLTFHDSRHEAITRLAKVFDVLELARIVGHRDLRMLLIYYNPSAEDLSGKLK